MASSRPRSSKLHDLDVTVVSAKHLKNVNWRSGDLKPYAILWVDPDRRLATRSDDSGSPQPVWNERFIVPISPPFQESTLTVEIFHSRPSETPKPLVGRLRFPLRDLVDSKNSSRVRVFPLTRPSGRPHGKIRLKLAVMERPPPPVLDYHGIPPTISYHSTFPPPPGRDYRGFLPSPAPSSLPSPAQSPPPPPPPYGMYSDPYAGCYPGYYPRAPPPPPPRPFFNPPANYGAPPGGPSAPFDYSSYESRPKGDFGVGAVTGSLGGLALEEGLKYEQEKMGKRVESDLTARDHYSDYRSNY